MPRDYKHRTYQQNASKPRNESSVSIWKWLLVVVIIALFVGFLLWLKSTATKNTPKTVVTQSQKKPIKYDFYNVLPGREVIIPEYQIETQKRLERQQAKQHPEKKPATVYMIQAGAFKAYREADKRKAQLILLGQSAYIEKVIMKGKTWHRVKIGSFNSLNEADDIRKQLKNKDIQSVIMKQKS
jgi:cell division protein FtsN